MDEDAGAKAKSSSKSYSVARATSSESLPSGVWTYQHVTTTPAGRATRTDFWHLTGRNKGNYVVIEFLTEFFPQGKWIKYPELLGDARSFYWKVRADFEDAQRKGDSITLVRGRSHLLVVQPKFAREAAVHNAGDLLGTQSQSFRLRNGVLSFSDDGQSLRPLNP